MYLSKSECVFVRMDIIAGKVRRVKITGNCEVPEVRAVSELWSTERAVYIFIYWVLRIQQFILKMFFKTISEEILIFLECLLIFIYVHLYNTSGPLPSYIFCIPIDNFWILKNSSQSVVFTEKNKSWDTSITLYVKVLATTFYGGICYLPI